MAIRQFGKFFLVLLPFFLYEGVMLATAFIIVAFLIFPKTQVKELLDQLEFRDFVFFIYLFHMLFGEREFAHIGLGKLYVTEMILGFMVCTYLFDLIRLKKILTPYYLLMLIGSLWGLAYVRFYGIDALRDALMLGYAIIVPVAYTVLNSEKKFELFFEILKIMIVLKALLFIYVTTMVFLGRYTLGFEAFRYSVGHIVPSLAVLTLFLPMKKYRSIYRICSMILLMSVFTTFHRSIFLGLTVAILGFMVVGSKQTQKTIVRYGAVGFVSLFIFIIYLNSLVDTDIFAYIAKKFSSGEANIQYRFKAWDLALEKFKNNFLMGFGLGKPIFINIGFRTFDTMDISYWEIAAMGGNAQPHNSYLNILTRFGILNFSLVLLAILYPLKRLNVVFKLRSVHTELFNKYLLLFGFVAFIYTYAAFNVTMESPQYAFPYWLSVAMVLRFSTVISLKKYSLKQLSGDKNTSTIQ